MVHLQILPLWSFFTLASYDHQDPKWPLKFFFQFSSIKKELQSCKTTILLHKSNYNGDPAIWLENDDAQWNLFLDHGTIPILSTKPAKVAKFNSPFAQVKHIFEIVIGRFYQKKVLFFTFYARFWTNDRVFNRFETIISRLVKIIRIACSS